MSKALVDTNDQAQLLKYLLVRELWRGGLSQAEIRSRLGLSMNAVNALLKGISRDTTHISEAAT
jgi:Trp operon repressor